MATLGKYGFAHAHYSCMYLRLGGWCSVLIFNNLNVDWQGPSPLSNCACAVLMLCYLGLGSRSSIFVFHNLIIDGRGHADGATREVWVEVLSLAKLDARRRVAVAVQQVVDVVLSTVPGITAKMFLKNVA